MRSGSQRPGDALAASWAGISRAILLMALALWGNNRGWAQAQPGDLEALLAGVRETAAPGTPGSLAVYGEQAFPVVAGSWGGRGTEGGKMLVARAAGPSLASFGVTEPLPDPALTIFAAPAGAALAANDDWGGESRLRTLFSQVGAFAFMAAESKDAAALVPAVSGAGYTAQVQGRPGERGRTLVELYDATAPGTFTAATPRLINVSLLQRLPAGGMLTVGFVVAGPGTKRILIRAAGPTLGLAPLSLAQVLPDPRLELFLGPASLAANDQWEVPQGAGAAPAPQLAEAFREAGAFRYAPGSRDAALVTTLGAGAYTVQVTAPAPVSGLTLVEVYELP